MAALTDNPVTTWIIGGVTSALLSLTIYTAKRLQKQVDKLEETIRQEFPALRIELTEFKGDLKVLKTQAKSVKSFARILLDMRLDVETLKENRQAASST